MPAPHPSPPGRTILVASAPITAHTLNATRFVTALTAAGHRVLWYAAERHRDHVLACGAEALSGSAGAFAPDDAWTAPGGLRGLAHVRGLYRDEVAGRAPVQVADLSGAIARHRPDVVLCDTLLPAAGIAAAAAGLAWATFGDGPLLWWDESTPPFGTGLPPMAGPAGRHRNRHVQRFIDRRLFAPAVDSLNLTRRTHGLPPVADIRAASLSPHLHLQGSSPSFEYSRDPLPSHIRFVGALGPGPGHAPAPPGACLRSRRTRPLAFVTQGTLRPDPRELAQPASRALVGLGLDVLVAGVPDGAWNRWPGRVSVVPRVDYALALHEADLFVTNGGWTGVTMAAAAGVPVLQSGASEEKPDIGARVVHSGIGAAVPLTRPPAALLRVLARRVLASPARRAASARLAAEMAAYDAGPLGARLLLDLAARDG